MCNTVNALARSKGVMMLHAYYVRCGVIFKQTAVLLPLRTTITCAGTPRRLVRLFLFLSLFLFLFFLFLFLFLYFSLLSFLSFFLLCRPYVGPSAGHIDHRRTDRTTSKQQPCPIGNRPAPSALACCLLRFLSFIFLICCVFSFPFLLRVFLSPFLLFLRVYPYMSWMDLFLV